MEKDCFSEQSIRRIRDALDAVPADNEYFSMHLSSVDLRAAFGWGEGFEIRCEDGRYLCTWHLERSTKFDEIPNEEEAVQLFIRRASAGKSRNNHV